MRQESSKLKNKQKVRILKNPRLRKIRYELRTLLSLEYYKKRKELYKRSGDIRGDKSISYDERKERLKRLLKDIEKLKLTFHRSTISCWVCGDRMNDLIQDPDSLFWFCVNCHQDFQFY